MKLYSNSAGDFTQISNDITKGFVGIIPTDTLYGFSCSVERRESVEKIYSIKQRESDKPFIILISNIEQIAFYTNQISLSQKDFLRNIWPARLTVIMDVPGEKHKYLHRGTYSLAFRIPAYDWLRRLINQTGPITSTTVNISGESPINDVTTAKEKFGNLIDFCVDAGPMNSLPSTIIKLKFDGKTEIIRQGSVSIDNR